MVRDTQQQDRSVRRQEAGDHSREEEEHVLCDRHEIHRGCPGSRVKSMLPDGLMVSEGALLHFLQLYLANARTVSRCKFVLGFQTPH